MTLDADIFLSNLGVTRGIVVDQEHNIYLNGATINLTTYEATSYIAKITPDRTFVDVLTGSVRDPTVRFTYAFESSKIFGLTSDGSIFTLNPESLELNMYLDLKSIDIDKTSFYDLSSDSEDPSTLLLPEYALYNDIAVREYGNVREFFITGQNGGLTGVIPFVLRVRFENDLLQEAKVLLSGIRIQRIPEGAGAVSILPPGIAMNSEGRVLTTFPVAPNLSLPDPNYLIPDDPDNPYDDNIPDGVDNPPEQIFTPIQLISFASDFNPTEDHPENLLDGVDSFGMTTDSDDNFYILANAAHSLGVDLGNISVISISSDVKEVFSLHNLGFLSDLPRGDIAIDSTLDKAYVTFHDSILSFSVPNYEPIPIILEISISDQSLVEGNEEVHNCIFNIKLNQSYDETITVDYTTSDGSAIAGEDYIAATGTLEFAPGETEKTFSVQVIGDTKVEEDESFKVNLSNPINAVISDGQANAVLKNDDIEENNNNLIKLYRFRNTTFETGTYIFVAEAEKDAILANPDLNQTFSLDGVTEDGTVNPAFTAGLTPDDELVPFYRLRSLDVPGTYLFVSTAEYNGIFADDSNQRDKWVKEGLDDNNIDIPEFYLYGVGANQGLEFNRFQNIQNNTFLYAGPGETEAIANDPNLSNLFINQGTAFESFI